MVTLNHLTVPDLHELESIPPFSELRVPERLHMLDNEWRVIHCGDVAQGTSERFILFVAATKCEIVACSIISAADVAGNDTNYNVYELYDGDPATANLIGSVHTKATAGTNGSSKLVADTLGTMDAVHRILAAGDVVAILIDEDTGGTGLAMTDVSVMLKVVPVDGGE